MYAGMHARAEEKGSAEKTLVYTHVCNCVIAARGNRACTRPTTITHQSTYLYVSVSYVCLFFCVRRSTIRRSAQWCWARWTWWAPGGTGVRCQPRRQHSRRSPITRTCSSLVWPPPRPNYLSHLPSQLIAADSAPERASVELASSLGRVSLSLSLSLSRVACPIRLD